VRQSGVVFLAVLVLSRGLLAPWALLLTALLTALLAAGAAPLSVVAILALVAAAAGWPLSLPEIPLAEAFAAAVFAAELFEAEPFRVALFRAELFDVELFKVELFRAEPLAVELVLAAGFAVFGLDFSGLGLAEFSGPAPELAMLAAVVAAAVEAIVAFLAGPLPVAVPVALAVPVVVVEVLAVAVAVVVAVWPAAEMGTELALAVVDLAVVGLPDIAPPVGLITIGLLVGLLVWPWPKAGLVVPGLGFTQGLLMGAAGKDCPGLAAVVDLALALGAAGLAGAGLEDTWLALPVGLTGLLGLAGVTGGGAVSLSRVPLSTRSGLLMLLITTNLSIGTLYPSAIWERLSPDCTTCSLALGL